MNGVRYKPTNMIEFVIIIVASGQLPRQHSKIERMGSHCAKLCPDLFKFKENSEACPTAAVSGEQRPRPKTASDRSFNLKQLFSNSYFAIKLPCQSKQSNEQIAHSGMYSSANERREILWKVASNKFLPKRNLSPTELGRISALHRDQSLTHTANGVKINTNVSSKILSRAQIERLSKQAPSADILLLTRPAFYNLDLIVPGLYLTAVTGLFWENIREKNVKLIINATHELPMLKSKDFVSYRVPVEDSEEDRSIGKYLEDVADLIEATRQESGRGATIVHCMGGVSRSTTLVLAYMIKYTNLDLHQAFRHVHSLRPVIRPNMTFMSLLRDLEIRLNKVASFEFEHVGNCIVPSFFKVEFHSLFLAELDRHKVNFVRPAKSTPKQKAKSVEQAKQR